MNVELKDLQIVFYEKEIAVFFPSWYNEVIEKMQVVASDDVQSKHYGIANHNGLLYVIISKSDAENLPLNIVIEEPQIEHIKPKQFI